ncbi:NADPH-dependent FMN reductase [Intrasporangium chromatireducens Q5-1]|uniref:NADPH-dependent FMN reductase n=1 Tax=Intrasporangium chromatireducens Q5-1 TaxID=584657 RepID=W9GNK5_9MICO|nr:FMN reductase [Intrasporangium chromatireducens]EWT07856.1 NADPH-dependent FMN reductase [Intrasporangium chromatireducens Q5-1]
MTTRIAVITAGITEPSSTRLLADRLAEATVRALGGPSAASVDVIDVRDIAHDVTNHVLTGFASPELQERLDLVAEADALIVSSPIYTASYSGLFKMLIDVLPKDSLRDKPVLLGATGGTARHSLAIDHALRPLFAYLGALVSPVAVFAASEDWGSTEAGRLGERIERAGGAFARLLTGAPAPKQVDPFENVTPFEALLADVTGAA